MYSMHISCARHFSVCFSCASGLFMHIWCVSHALFMCTAISRTSEVFPMCFSCAQPIFMHIWCVFHAFLMCFPCVFHVRDSYSCASDVFLMCNRHPEGMARYAFVRQKASCQGSFPPESPGNTSHISCVSHAHLMCIENSLLIFGYS